MGESEREKLAVGLGVQAALEERDVHSPAGWERCVVLLHNYLPSVGESDKLS